MKRNGETQIDRRHFRLVEWLCELTKSNERKDNYVSPCRVIYDL